MISAEVIKGVQELLVRHGKRQKPGERVGDFVARGMEITERQAEILLQCLHDGASLDEAMHAAGVDPANTNRDLLVEVARAIGSALGHLKC